MIDGLDVQGSMDDSMGGVRDDKGGADSTDDLTRQEFTTMETVEIYPISVFFHPNNEVNLIHLLHEIHNI